MSDTAKDSLKKKFKIKIPYSEVEREMNENFLELSKTLKLAGFRPGKIPISFVKNKYEKDVRSKVTEKLLQNEGNKKFESKGYRLAAEPKVKLISKIDDKVDLEAEYEFEILPDIVLQDFKTLELDKYISKVEENEIKKVIDNLFNDYKDYKDLQTERNSKLGDRLVISYRGFINEKQFEGGTAEKQFIDLGKNNFLPEFEKNIIDKPKNKEISFFVTFPKDYNREDLKGKKAKFVVTIDNIMEGKRLKNEDELALKTGAKNAVDLRSKIENELKKYSEELSFSVLKKSIVEKLSGLYSFSLPEILVDREMDLIKKEKSNNKSEEKISDNLVKKEAEDKVKIGLIISEIGIKNKINVTEKELESALAKVCMQYPEEKRR